ncbi:2-phospho-L-lactate guanylyltransferase [Nocardioides terrisoli]|uniref:2-phospho-L-lactate guanylyltransferase n=1 Tax=Nocardioides terrisoli TaxID=3388267 RepID=UPI00287BB665|nr:2-phospho-L-lactate guanylyltransferase [Nocardioides marmorisolisilvae]
MSESPTYALLVPVKAWDRAKTRLRRSPTRADELPAAFALDAVAAAVACPLVASTWVVTDQPGFHPPGTVLLPDRGAGDLNAALRAAEAHVRTHDAALGVAVLLADLPCLRASELTAALESGGAARRYVADSQGTGTTLLVASSEVALDPQFGEGSAARHLAGGATPVALDLPGLRLDVDTADDLARAVRLGVGAHTAAALRRGR